MTQHHFGRICHHHSRLRQLRTVTYGILKPLHLSSHEIPRPLRRRSSFHSDLRLCSGRRGHIRQETWEERKIRGFFDLGDGGRDRLTKQGVGEKSRRKRDTFSIRPSWFLCFSCGQDTVCIWYLHLTSLSNTWQSNSTVAALSVSVRPFVRMFLLWWLNWLIERHANLLCLPAWNEEQGQSLPFVEDRAFLPSIHISTLSG